MIRNPGSINVMHKSAYHPPHSSSSPPSSPSIIRKQLRSDNFGISAVQWLKSVRIVEKMMKNVKNVRN